MSAAEEMGTSTSETLTPEDIYWTAPISVPNASWPPHTDSDAQPTDWFEVKNAHVIRVKQGRFRTATFSGAFLLAAEGLATAHRGEVDVYCRWYGRRLQTRGIRITVDMSMCEIDAAYSGFVITNLQGKTRPPLVD